VQQVSYGPLIMSMLIMSCYTGFFNVRRGWQSLNMGPRFYLRLFRKTGWLWISTSHLETLILHRFQIRAQKKLRGFRSRACHRDYFLNSTVDFTFNKEISMETNPAGTPGYRNGTESFFGLKGRPSHRSNEYQTIRNREPVCTWLDDKTPWIYLDQII
jgi:hypothetical protein